MMNNPYLSALLGVAVGDAIGVPVEFSSRAARKADPVTGVRGYGSHRQPPGTFSDDSSLTFCLAEAMTKRLTMNRLADNFIAWANKGYWGAYDKVFDIGIGTRYAIQRLAAGCAPEAAGGFDENENGNGSLMRILPLVFHIKDLPITERYALTKSVSSLTHAHIRSVIACFYYLEFSRLVLQGQGKFQAYQELRIHLKPFLQQLEIDPSETGLFHRLLDSDIEQVGENDIRGSGYVLASLEAAMWCLLTSNSYEETVLKAVNLGEDTDTTGAIAGGLAGLLYGYENIPAEWLEVLARSEDIKDLAGRLQKVYG